MLICLQSDVLISMLNSLFQIVGPTLYYPEVRTAVSLAVKGLPVNFSFFQINSLTNAVGNPIQENVNEDA